MSAKRMIRLCYRKVIDTSSQKPWDKLVFESTYKEFLMQSQFYNPGNKYNTFSEILMNVPASERLHFLVSASVIGYLQQLGGKIPDMLNTLGKQFLEFKNYRFEIINSDIKEKSRHQIAISFFSEPMIWHDTIDTYLLLSPAGGERNDEGILTDMMQLQPFLGIYSLKTEADNEPIKS